jgi:DinB superfamily
MDAPGQLDNRMNFLIRRPQVADAPPYYFTYINQAAGDNPLLALEDQLEEALALFSTISEDRSLYRYLPEKWNIRQVLNHITDTERVFSFRSLWFARGFDSSLPSFDQHLAASGAQADGIAWAAHVGEFRQVRLATISLFGNMPSPGWDKAGISSNNHFRVRTLAYIIVGHCQHLVALLRKHYL